MTHKRERTADNAEDWCTKCGKHDPHLDYRDEFGISTGKETSCIDDKPMDYSPVDPTVLI